MFFIQFLDHIIIVKIGDRIVKFGTHDCLFLTPIPNIISKYLDLGRFGQGQKILGPAKNNYSCYQHNYQRHLWILASFSKNPSLVSLNILNNELKLRQFLNHRLVGYISFEINWSEGSEILRVVFLDNRRIHRCLWARK